MSLIVSGPMQKCPLTLQAANVEYFSSFEVRKTLKSRNDTYREEKLIVDICISVVYYIFVLYVLLLSVKGE